MDLELAEMVELYEYKVADLVAGREPRGGLASLKRLRSQLIPLLSGSRMMRRFMQSDQQYRALEMKPVLPISGTGGTPPLQLGNWGIQTGIPSPVVAPSGEEELLRQLATDLYWMQLERSLSDQLAPLLVGNREAARLAYAALQNLQALEGSSPLMSNAALIHYQPGYLIPRVSDTLVRLEAASLRGVIAELVREIYTALLPVAPDHREVRVGLERFLLRMVQATETQTNDRRLQQVREAQDERRPEAQRRQAQDEARRQALLAADDRQKFMLAVQQLLDLLCRSLPNPLGPAHLPNLPQGILAAREPAHQLAAPAPDQTSVTLRLVPMRLRLAGYDLTLVGSRGTFALVVAQVEYPIDEAQARVVVLTHHELWLLPRAGYLHLHLVPRVGDALAGRLAEGRLLAYLLWPGQHYGYLRLMRALSARLKGATDLLPFSPASAERYPQAPPDALEEFVRKGLAGLLTRLRQNPSWPSMLEEAGYQLALTGYVAQLQQLLQHWLVPPPLPPDIPLYTLAAQPLALEEGGLAFSLWMEEGVVGVRVSGHTPRRLSDLLVWSAPQGIVLFVCDGHTILCQRVLGTEA